MDAEAVAQVAVDRAIAVAVALDCSEVSDCREDPVNPVAIRVVAIVAVGSQRMSRAVWPAGFVATDTAVPMDVHLGVADAPAVWLGSWDGNKGDWITAPTSTQDCLVIKQPNKCKTNRLRLDHRLDR